MLFILKNHSNNLRWFSSASP